MTQPKQTTPVALRIPEHILQWLDTQAESLVLTRTDIVLQCILAVKAQNELPMSSVFRLQPPKQETKEAKHPHPGNQEDQNSRKEENTPRPEIKTLVSAIAYARSKGMKELQVIEGPTGILGYSIEALVRAADLGWKYAVRPSLLRDLQADKRYVDMASWPVLREVKPKFQEFDDAGDLIEPKAFSEEDQKTRAMAFVQAWISYAGVMQGIDDPWANLRRLPEIPNYEEDVEFAKHFKRCLRDLTSTKP